MESLAVRLVVWAVARTGKAWRWIRALFTADHQTILRASRSIDGTRTFCVQVAVAPSRNIRRPRPLDPGDGRRFVAHAFPGLDLKLEYSDPDVLRFGGPEVRGWPSATIRLEKSGLVDAVIDLAYRQDEDETRLDVLDILEPVRSLSETIRDGTYATTFALGRHRRVDMVFNVTPHIYSGGSPLYWTSLTFPGHDPERLTAQRPFSPVGGYARPDLRSLRQGHAYASVPARALTDLLLRSGYGNVTPAVEDSVKALQRTQLGARGASSEDPHSGKWP